MIRLCYFLAFLVFSASCVGQKLELTKRKLLKVLKSSIQQSSKKWIQTNSNPWTICNKDSFYYKSDTIHLYSANNSQYRNHTSCCDFIEWTFYRKDAFVLTRAELCREPPTVSVSKSEDWFTIKVSKEMGVLTLTTFNHEKMIDKYKVINIEPDIVLIKQKLD